MLTYLTLISVPVGVFYHIMTLNNTRKTEQLQLETRQAQLFMSLYETFRSPTFRKHLDEVLFIMEFEDWDDMERKFDPVEHSDERISWFSVGAFFEGVGVLLKRKLIDISMVDDLLATPIRLSWEKMGPIEMESRKRLNLPRLWDDFEFLYKELMKYHEEHPELKT